MRNFIRIPYHPRANFINFWTWAVARRLRGLLGCTPSWQTTSDRLAWSSASCSYASSALLLHTLAMFAPHANDGDSTK